MFRVDDREAARRVYASWVAECAYHGAIELLGDTDTLVEDKPFGAKLDENHCEEMGSGPWEPEGKGGAKFHLIAWAFDLLNGDTELAEEEYENLKLSLKHGGKYDFEIKKELAAA